jgi:hypothetical protein
VHLEVHLENLGVLLKEHRLTGGDDTAVGVDPGLLFDTRKDLGDASADEGVARHPEDALEPRVYLEENVVDGLTVVVRYELV